MFDAATKPDFITAVDPEVIKKRNARSETGAIWKSHSKKNGMEYMNIKMRFNKEQLEGLLEKLGDKEEISTNFVAFPNKNLEDNPRRPLYKIYEEIS